MNRLRLRLAAGLTACAALAGCGLPSRDVQRLDPDTVPFGLLASAPPTATANPAGPSALVYFVSRDRLRTATRHVVADNLAAEAVRALLVGPTALEAAEGYATDVPAQTRLISLDLNGSVATVDLSSDFGTVGGSEQVLAVAQIVFTLTESPDIRGVRFAINGQPAEVPDASGSLSAAPRTRADYGEVAPHR